MKVFRQSVLPASFAIMVALTLCSDMLIRVDAQTRLTYPELITALNTKLPNQVFKNKGELLKWLILQVKSRKVDKALSKDREDDLLQAGATDELLATIRANSPALPKASPSPDPREAVVDLGELSGRATSLVKPDFTPEALKAGVTGSVRLKLELDEAGRVTSATPLTTLGNGLTEQALGAARKSTFSPALIDGKPSRAVGTITYNFKINRIDIVPILAAADEARKRSECDKAIPDYSRVITVNDQESRAYAGRGLCYLIKADYARALPDLESAATLDATNPEAFVQLAVVNDFKGNFKASAANYEKAISLMPQLANRPMIRCLYIDKPGITVEQARASADDIIEGCNIFFKNAPDFLTSLVYVKRGTGFRFKGEYDKAIDNFETARRLNPQFLAIQSHLMAAYNSRGQQHFSKKEYKEAYEDVTTAINIDPRNPVPYVNRCVINLYGRKDYDHALEDCNAAIRLSDKSSMAYNHRGFAYEMKKNREAAVADYSKALEIDPNNQVARDNLGRLRPSMKTP